MYGKDTKSSIKYFNIFIYSHVNFATTLIQNNLTTTSILNVGLSFV